VILYFSWNRKQLRNDGWWELRAQQLREEEEHYLKRGSVLSKNSSRLGKWKRGISKKMERQCEKGHGVDWAERICA